MQKYNIGRMKNSILEQSNKTDSELVSMKKFDFFEPRNAEAMMVSFHSANDYGCFLSGTFVNVSTDEYKCIEQFDIGDPVLSYDFAQKKFVQNSVITVYKTVKSRYYCINGILSVTETHPFFVDGKWVKAINLSVGDKVLDVNLNEVTIESIMAVNNPALVYNLKVGNTQTYFVHDILVHNKSVV